MLQLLISFKTDLQPLRPLKFPPQPFLLLWRLLLCVSENDKRKLDFFHSRTKANQKFESQNEKLITEVQKVPGSLLASWRGGAPRWQTDEMAQNLFREEGVKQFFSQHLSFCRLFLHLLIRICFWMHSSRKSIHKDINLGFCLNIRGGGWKRSRRLSWG